MRHEMAPTRITQALCMALVCIGTMGVAQAQHKPETTLLITEVVASSTPDQEPDTQFWWANLERPRWSELDRALRGALEEQGVTWSKTSGKGKNISKIYLRPNLARENATTLASLLGAEQVYYGSITYEPLTMPATSKEKGVRVMVNVELVDVRTKSADEVKLVMERVVIEESDKLAMTRAREDVVEALSQVMARHISLTAGPIGPVASQERWIVLRGAEDGHRLEYARKRIEALEEVEEVHIAWSAAGYIALDVNPGKQDDQGVLERVQRTLIESQETIDGGESWRWELEQDTNLASGIVMRPVIVQPLEPEDRGE